MDKIHLHSNVIVTYTHPYNSSIVMRGCYQHYETMLTKDAECPKLLSVRKEEISSKVESLFRDYYPSFIYYDRAVMKITDVKVFPVKDSLPVQSEKMIKSFSNINKAIKRNLKSSLEKEVLGVGLNTIILKNGEKYEEFIRLNFDT